MPDDWLYVALPIFEFDEFYILAAKKVLGENNVFVAVDQSTSEKMLILRVADKAQLLLPQRYKEAQVLSVGVTAGISPQSSRYLYTNHSGRNLSLGVLNSGNRNFRQISSSGGCLYLVAPEQVFDYMLFVPSQSNEADIVDISRHVLVKRTVKLRYLNKAVGTESDGVFAIEAQRETLFEFQVRAKEVPGQRRWRGLSDLARFLLGPSSSRKGETRKVPSPVYCSFDAKEVPVGNPYSADEIRSILRQYPEEYRNSAFYRYMSHHYPEGGTLDERVERALELAGIEVPEEAQAAR